ncbi:MAG: hypothetical protein JWP35_3511 [Caulobacter sp.]|nr:hypothetical protein [Caulobacter sp.]
MVAVTKPLPSALTDELIDIAITAAAAVYGDDVRLARSSSNSAQRRCLAPAALALARVLGAPIIRTAPLVGLHPTSPGLYRRNWTALHESAREAAEEACRAFLGPVTDKAAERTPAEKRKAGVWPTVTAEDRALIDRAVQAGRITVVPSGQAAGLTRLEDRLWAAPPALPPHLARARWNGQLQSRLAQRRAS